MSNDTTMLHAALSLAGKGKAVFPCHHIDCTGRCSCRNPDCKNPGKHPRTEHGFKDATTDRETIELWWTKWPQANIGMPTGAITRTVVLDTDPRNGGSESFYELQEDHEKLPDTLSQRTGGGGHHSLFEIPAGHAIKSGPLEGYPGIDIKAEGGYIIVAPSRTDGPYAWVNANVPPAPLPPWLLELVVEKPKAKAEPLPDKIPEGKRNTTFASMAGSMRQCGFSSEAILAGLKIANRDGADQPLGETELEGIAQSVGRYEPGSTDPIYETSAILRLASEIEVKEVEWLWKPYIPKGKLTVVVGHPGVGKSFLALALTAIVSNGHPFPDLETGIPDKSDRTTPGTVLYASVEDAPNDTLVPRLMAMEANLENVTFLEGVRKKDPETEEWFVDILSFGNLKIIEEAFKETGCTLAIFDPLQGFGGGANMNHAHEIRRMLAPMATLAEKHEVAILLIAHPRKSSADRSLQRLSGSMDIGAAARSVLLVGDAPQKQGERAIVQIKNNLAKFGPSLGYAIEDDGGSGVFRWTGISDLTQGDLLAPEQGPEEQTALDDAKDFLDDILESGPVPVPTLKTDSKKAGIAWRTLERAKKEMGIKSDHPGGPNSPWCWVKKGKDRQTPIYRDVGGLNPQKEPEIPAVIDLPKDRQWSDSRAEQGTLGGLNKDEAKHWEGEV